MRYYLRAALIAGKYPEATTHFKVDYNYRLNRVLPDAHCDPRCFNLNELYRLIAKQMNHPLGSEYGIKPSYGKTPGTHNIWRDKDFCYTSAPS